MPARSRDISIITLGWIAVQQQGRIQDQKRSSMQMIVARSCRKLDQRTAVSINTFMT